MISDPKCRTQPGCVASYTSFVNTYSTMLANIKHLKATAEDILMDILLQNVDNDTRSRFEDFVGMTTSTPTFKQLTTFFNKEKLVCANKQKINTTIKEKNKGNPSSSKPENKSHQSTSKSFVTEDRAAKTPECFICKGAHRVVDCDQFLASKHRESLLKQHKICIFCTKHKFDRYHRCRSLNYLSCDRCKGKHITLMHPLEENNESTETSTTLLTQEASTKFSLLPTAIANILDANGEPRPVRCLVDLCAESSYVCEDLVQKLRLKKLKTKVIISGINGISGKATSFVELVIKLEDPNLQDIITKALVVPKVTGNLPSKSVPEHLIQIKHKLADPSFLKPSFVGVLLECGRGDKIIQTG